MPRPPAPNGESLCCPACGGEMVQKKRARLVVTGVIMGASLALALIWPAFWAPGIVIALTGVYLMVWATLGRGRWCRSCKKFPLP